LATAVALFVVGYLRQQPSIDGGDSLPRRHLPAQVTLWVGDVRPGLQCALTEVYGDPRADLAHDAELSAVLGADAKSPLGFYRLLLFNTSDEIQRYEIQDDGLLVRGAAGAAAGLRRLSDLATLGAKDDAGVLFSLRALGTLREDVEIEPGTMANLVLAFARHSDLEEAEAVETAEGVPLRRLSRSRRELRDLMADPRAEVVQKLR
jgi:hypothetical protein